MLAEDHIAGHTTLRYRVALDKLSPTLADRYFPLFADAAILKFIAEARLLRVRGFKAWIHRQLRSWLSDFDVNGLLDTYPLQLLSALQFSLFLDRSPRMAGSLLDIGAGDGHVTRELAQSFDAVHCVQRSRFMRSRLKKRGFVAHDPSVIGGNPAKILDENPAAFQVVALLNVIDRCPNPHELIEEAKACLSSDGRILVSTPLPLRPFYYDGPRTLDQLSPIPTSEGSFETCLQALSTDFLEAHGLQIERFSRAPYLSGGDEYCDFYNLDAAILLLRRTD